jgi:(p)ppGpp synthase/HD superfamily hydrolase
MKVAILAMNMQKRSDNKTTISLKIGCKNIDHVNSIVSRIRHIKDVDRVERGFS